MVLKEIAKAGKSTKQNAQNKNIRQEKLYQQLYIHFYYLEFETCIHGGNSSHIETLFYFVLLRLQNPNYARCLKVEVCWMYFGFCFSIIKISTFCFIYSPKRLYKNYYDSMTNFSRLYWITNSIQWTETRHLQYILIRLWICLLTNFNIFKTIAEICASKTLLTQVYTYREFFNWTNKWNRQLACFYPNFQIYK